VTIKSTLKEDSRQQLKDLATALSKA
jgi:hypothetical protein